MTVTIYHNPACGTSRNALAMIRATGTEPVVVEYLKTPPSRALLVQLIDRAGITPRELLREKGTPYAINRRCRRKNRRNSPFPPLILASKSGPMNAIW